ncbi:hypothetical protein HDU98_010967 [Podochytrium sp. JEL0797]|nr:hypothetical protein HDU98_010967 [Podochytrium sp. JEL0797]
MHEMNAKTGSAAAKYYTGDEGKAPDTSEADTKRKMLHLLQRFESGEVGVLEESMRLSDGEEEDEDDVLEERLRGLDLDNLTTEELMALLPESHLKAFEAQVASGEILSSESFTDAIATPWWLNRDSSTNPIIQDLSEPQPSPSTTIDSKLSHKPAAIFDLVPFSALTRANPHASLPFNTVELLCVYTVVNRHLNGDWEDTDSARDARELFVELSLVLKDAAGGGAFGYDSIEAAVVGVWDRVIRMNSILLDPRATTSATPANHVLGLLWTDLQAILQSRDKIVSALSHTHFLFNDPAGATKQDKKANLRVARKLLFYTCFAADVGVFGDDMVKALAQGVEKEVKRREGLDKIDEEVGGDVDARKAREEVLKRVKREDEKPRVLVEEI